MSRHNPFDEQTYQYLLSVSVREPEVARRLREETQQLENGQMQIGPDQGQSRSEPGQEPDQNAEARPDRQWKRTKRQRPRPWQGNARTASLARQSAARW